MTVPGGALGPRAAGLTRPGKTCRLPTGLPVHYVSRDDVRFLYKEIYIDRVQLQHGVRLNPGGVVLDVGANIGLFSLFAAEQVGPQGLVIAAEPLPATFTALEANVRAHQQWCRERGLPCSPITLLNFGLGDGSSSSAVFTLYEKAAGWGTMRPDEDEVLRDMGVFLQNALGPSRAGAPSVLSGPARLLGAALRRWAPAGAYEAAWRLAVRRMLGSRRQHECRLQSVSQLLDDLGIDRLDLLKVDVERAELEVLRGVQPRHWPAIRQAVLEVHASNLEGVLGLLRGPGGFATGDVVVEQEEDLRGTSLYMVYCTRRACS